MVIADYFKTVEQKLNNSKLIADKTVDFKEFSSDEGMIRGQLLFLGGYVLNFMEYIQIGKVRPKYRFNLSDRKGDMIFRYDNAAKSKDIGLVEVLFEIEDLILSDFY